MCFSTLVWTFSTSTWMRQKLRKRESNIFMHPNIRWHHGVVCSSVPESIWKVARFFLQNPLPMVLSQADHPKKLRCEDLILQHVFAKARTKNEELIFASHGDGDCVWATEGVANRHPFVTTEGLLMSKI